VHFLFVESNTTGTGHLAIERLLARGDRVTLCCGDRTRYPFLDALRSSPGLQVVEADTNDPAALAHAIDEATRDCVADALLTFSTFYVAQVAKLAAERKLRCLSPEAAERCHDKYETRLALSRAGLPTPEFWLITTEAEARELADRATFPLVAKPRAGSSSAGVKLMTCPTELLAHIAMLRARTVNERGQVSKPHALVEQMLDGPEFSVETFSLDPFRTVVIGVTAKHLSPAPYFTELGHDFPANLPGAEEAAIVACALEALRAVGFDSGPAHTEIRLTNRGPVVIEINPRLAGGMIPELIRYARGIDLTSTWLDFALGCEVDLAPSRSEVAGIRFLTAPKDGRLVAVEGLADASVIDGTRVVRFDGKLGQTVRRPTSGLDRLGFVIASGPDAGQVERSLTAATQRIQIQVEG